MELKIEQNFTDKYTNENYKIGDVITVEKARGEELLADTRNLVSLVKKVKPKIENE